MGELIHTSDWLIDLARRGGGYRILAKRLIGMHLGVCYRTGHLPIVTDPEVRRLIVYCALAQENYHIPVECARCGISTRLANWELLGSMGISSHIEAVIQAGREGSIPSFGYLLQCKPGTDSGHHHDGDHQPGGLVQRLRAAKDAGEVAE
jgi:hypothetical protein